MSPSLPPMGFNTWNRYHCWIDESELKKTADLLVKLGLRAAGYTHLNIDDCWCGNFDINLDHFPHSFNLYTALHAPCAVICLVPMRIGC